MMIYYVSEGNETVKYDVTIDFLKLQRIRETVSERCMEATKISCAGPKEVIPKEGETITDVKKRFLYNESIPSSNQTIPIYQWEYVSYQLPKLVFLIDQLMDGDMGVIRELVSPQVEDTNKEKIEKAINGMFPIQATTNFDQLISYIREYKEHVFLNQIRIETLGKSKILSYYSEVLDCIQMEEVKRFSNQDMDAAIQFFKDELGDVLEELALIKEDSALEDGEEVLEENLEVQKKKGSF